MLFLRIKSLFRAINRLIEHKLYPSYRLHRRIIGLTLILVVSTSFITSVLVNASRKSPHVMASPATTPRPEFWVTNGSVNDMAEGPDGTIYMGGYFDRVAPYTGNAIPIDSTTGNIESTYPKVEAGSVNVILPDGSGGWYFGGDFTKIGGVNRVGLAISSLTELSTQPGLLI